MGRVAQRGGVGGTWARRRQAVGPVVLCRKSAEDVPRAKSWDWIPRQAARGRAASSRQKPPRPAAPALGNSRRHAHQEVTLPSGCDPGP